MKLRWWHFHRRSGAVVLLSLLPALVDCARGANAAGGTNGPGGNLSEAYVSPTNGLGSWIWASNVFDGQTCQLWNTFEVPSSSSVTNARLVMTADNEFTLYLDGRELGRGAEWRELFVFNITPLLAAGRHALAVRAYNSFSFAGMLFGLRMNLADGRVLEVKSDESWRIVPDGGTRWESRTEPAEDWPAATIKAPLGGGPWWTTPENVNVMPTLQPITLAFWQTGWFQLTLLTVCGGVILISLRLMAQLALHRKERWLLQQERTRIAREIHDDIGSRMTQLVLHGEVAQRGVSDGSPIQLQLTQICEEMRGLLATMDEILWAVNPQRDTLRDFAAYVCKYAEEFLRPTPIQCLFDVDSEMPAVVLNLPLRRSLLMAIKEALNNAVKYSKATELSLLIHWRGHRLIVVVQDNGRGFDPAAVRSGRYGMTNMQERMKELGGSCQVTSAPGQGCRVALSIPLRRPRTGLWARIGNAESPSLLNHKTERVRSNQGALNHEPRRKA